MASGGAGSTTAESLAALLADLSPQGPPTAAFVHNASAAAAATEKVGVLSASYNPPTAAHMMLCRSAHEQLQFNEIALLLTAVNADKKVTGASLPQRLQMLERLASRGEAKIDAPLSIVACSHPRFVDMAQALSALYENERQSKPTFYFILGYDTLVRVFDPKYYKDMAAELAPFFAKAHVVAFNRDDDNESAIQQVLARPEVALFRSKIYACTITDPLINTASSTEARARTKDGRDASDLLAPSTIDFIRESGLYLD